MNTATVCTFKYAELDGAAQKRLRKSEQEFIWELMIPDMSRELSRIYGRDMLPAEGYEGMEDVCFSLSNCQGDGMAFYGSLNEADLLTLFKKLCGGPERSWRVAAKADLVLARMLKMPNCAMTGTITRNNSHYCHENTMTVELDWEKMLPIPESTYGAYDWADWTPAETKALSDFEAAIQDDVRDVSIRLRNYGYDFLDMDTSDEALDRTIAEYNHDYLSDGTVFRFDEKDEPELTTPEALATEHSTQTARDTSPLWVSIGGD